MSEHNPFPEVRIRQGNIQSKSIHVETAKTLGERVGERRRRFANSPSDFNKLGLAAALLWNGESVEAAARTSEVEQDDPSKFVRQASVSYGDTYREYLFALKRARSDEQ